MPARAAGSFTWIAAYMILCITLNACLDKTLTVPPWRAGDLVRGHAVREVVGGKGNNVARALLRLGRQPRPVTFLGGPVGSHCESLLRADDGLLPLVVRTLAPTRVILTVRTEASAGQTAFFDPDPSITTAEADALARQVELALQSDTVEALTFIRLEPGTRDAWAVQRFDFAGPRARNTRLPRHLRTGPQSNLGDLADCDAAQPA